jgi:dTDP-4-amino-4,6-dideoxy-D-galactose acyltransferase
MIAQTEGIDHETGRQASTMCAAMVQTREILEPLLWDSQHFGFRVARIKEPELGEPELRQSLCAAREEKNRLVYWSADPRIEVSQSILREFHGLLVDRKATFRKTLVWAEPDSDSWVSGHIVEHPRSEPGSDLVRLAISAGAYSRFRRDPRVSEESFQRLYEIWINRSVKGELADMVLVADRGTVLDDPVGLITLSLAGRQGLIGLIAVDESARGCGIGSKLIRAAHRWLLSHGVRNVEVVTQLDNQIACRFYEKCGYTRDELQHVYHFWP